MKTTQEHFEKVRHALEAEISQLEIDVGLISSDTVREYARRLIIQRETEILELDKRFVTEGEK